MLTNGSPNLLQEWQRAQLCALQVHHQGRQRLLLGRAGYADSVSDCKAIQQSAGRGEGLDEIGLHHTLN